jgi:hypothetical protein
VLIGLDGLLAAAVLSLPWYALDDYVATGWEGTAWLRAVVVLALLNVVLASRGAGPLLVASSLLALGLVAFRVIVPPDFGFGFDGLVVPVERRAGCWAGLVLALASGGLAAWEARSAPPRRAGG